MNSEVTPLVLTPDQLSDYLGVPVRTLYRWRTHGEGPPAIRMGRHLRYRSTAVEQWLEDRETNSSRGGV